MKPKLPLKYHGGKAYLADRIVQLMSKIKYVHYVEPYFGGGAVLFAKPPTGSEVVNDINGRLMNFWYTLQDPERFNQFVRFMQAVPFSQEQWDRAHSWNGEPGTLDDACAFFVDCRMSMAGRLKCFAPLSRNRTRRGINEQSSAWLNSVEGLEDAHARLIRVAVLTGNAVDVIKTQDGPLTMHYLDPPYLHSTRESTDVYVHEMTVADHEEMIRTILATKGNVVLSGYKSDLYMDLLKGWNLIEIDVPNNSAGGKEKRRMTECLWTTI